MKFTRNEKIVILILLISTLFSYFSGLDYIIADYIGSGFNVEIWLFFGYTYYLIYMGVVSIILLIKNRIGLAAFILHIIFNCILHWIFTFYLNRPRPSGASREGPLLDEIYENNFGSSFPSGHSAIAASGYTVFSLAGLGRWHILIASIPIVLSRILMNHHYLSDNLAGILIGFIITKFLFDLFKKYDIENKAIHYIKNKYLQKNKK